MATRIDDQSVAQRILDHIDSGANEVFTFGLFESAIVHFHRALDAALAGRIFFPLYD